jgi:hypothetical protein
MAAHISYRLVHQNYDPLQRIEGFIIEKYFVMSDFGIGFEEETIGMSDNSLSDERGDLTAAAIPQ